jgi:5-methylcytosine-specific restriction protein A
VPKPLDRRIRNREYDARRRAEKPWRAWYSTARWQRIREAQFAAHRLCQRCLDRGLVEPATIVHHVDRHEGDPVKFWNGPFASSCQPCHDIDEQRIERGGQARQTIGPDGWPVDG